MDIRILYLNDNLSLGDWMALFPKAEVRVWYFDPERIHEVFKEHLFALYLPKDDEECGRQEVLFDGMQRFAVEGMSIAKSPARGALFTEEVEPP